MANCVRYIKAVGIHERFDLEQDFRHGVNILYGKNGTGKTTLLHILANILNGDFERFAFLPFETIEVNLDEGQKIKLRKYTHSEGNKVEAIIDKVQVASFSETQIREMSRYRPGLARTEQQASMLREYQSLKSILPTAYFPAFRTLIEASSDEDAYDPFPPRYVSGNPPRYASIRAYERQVLSSTIFARRFFGDFVPWINYPSPIEVSQRLAAEMQQALNIVANIDRQLLSKAFLDIFATLSEESDLSQDQQPEPILEKIKSLFSRLEDSSIISDPSAGEEVYSKLRELVLSFRVRPGREVVYVPILEVYKQSLEERASIQEKSLKTIKTYLDSVNRFLDGKDLVLRKAKTTQPIVQVKFHETDLYSPIGVLSSGERQIATLIYSATHMSSQKVVLIDEPEISLHIDWQSLLIPEIVAQLQDRQIITCTHSPMIGADYEDQMSELEIRQTNKKHGYSEDVDAVEEIEENL